jgi:monoamine oxidase
MSLPSSADVAIIGAGAAGLGATHALKDFGLSFVVLEARELHPRSPTNSTIALAEPAIPLRAASTPTRCPDMPANAPCSPAPVDGRLFFPGEATSPNFFTTAHGARGSGERAAREVLGTANRVK